MSDIQSLLARAARVAATPADAGWLRAAASHAALSDWTAVAGDLALVDSLPLGLAGALEAALAERGVDLA